MDAIRGPGCHDMPVTVTHENDRQAIQRNQMVRLRRRCRMDQALRRREGLVQVQGAGALVQHSMGGCARSAQVAGELGKS